MDNSSQNNQLRSPSVDFADSVRCLEQPRKFGRGIVGGDPTGNMTEQVLAILETYTSCPKPSAEGMFKVMNTNLRQIRTITRMNPTGF